MIYRILPMGNFMSVFCVPRSQGQFLPVRPWLSPDHKDALAYAAVLIDLVRDRSCIACLLSWRLEVMDCDGAWTPVGWVPESETINGPIEPKCAPYLL